VIQDRFFVVGDGDDKLPLIITMAARQRNCALSVDQPCKIAGLDRR
jgi:hypothetical protein